MKNNLPLIVGAIVIVVLLFFVVRGGGGSGPLDSFASCLKNKGATFYGAFWCPHCANQKKLFGKSEKLLAYVECSTPDGKGQLQICKEENITSYPTWDLKPIGEATTTTRLTGEIALEILAEKTGCKLPAPIK